MICRLNAFLPYIIMSRVQLYDVIELLATGHSKKSLPRKVT
jgi:hypothetical protein